MKALKYILLFSLSFSIFGSWAQTTNIPQDSSLFMKGEVISVIDSEILSEISGAASSSQNTDCLWVHNDSGDAPRIFLLNLSGEIIAEVSLPGASNRDWEDIALFDNYIYIAETGDNNQVYPTKKIYRIAEPVVDVDQLGQQLVIEEFETMEFDYADQKRDCETLMVDPLSGDLVLVSKRERENVVYQTPFTPTAEGEPLALLPLITLPLTYATAGDISGDGMMILVKNYWAIYLWQRASADEPLSETFSRTPVTIPYVIEPQGEAVAWSVEQDCFYTISENRESVVPKIYRYQKN